MATKTKFGLKGKDRDSYLELVLAFPLASIKSDEHLAKAQRGIGVLQFSVQVDGLFSGGVVGLERGRGLVGER